MAIKTISLDLERKEAKTEVQVYCINVKMTIENIFIVDTFRETINMRFSNQKKKIEEKKTKQKYTKATKQKFLRKSIECGSRINDRPLT